MSDFNYRDKEVPKLSDEFKAKFIVNIKGKEAVKVDGLVALAHQKGIKSMKTTILQWPTQENGFFCIAQCHLIGYDWSPIEEKIIEVEFVDFADASPNNCAAMTKDSYIRMASTRATGRTLRKYTNIDMVTSEEINTTVDNVEPMITGDQLAKMKLLLAEKHVDSASFSRIMMQTFTHTNYMGLTVRQGDTLLEILEKMAPIQQAQQPGQVAQQPQQGQVAQQQTQAQPVQQ